MKDFGPAPFLQISVFCPFKLRPFPPPRHFQPQKFFTPCFAQAQGCVRISGDGAFSSPRYKENKKLTQSTLFLGAQASLKCQKRLRKTNARFPRVPSKTGFKDFSPTPSCFQIWLNQEVKCDFPQPVGGAFSLFVPRGKKFGMFADYDVSESGGTGPFLARSHYGK